MTDDAIPMKARLARMQQAVEEAAEALPPDIELTFRAMFGGIGASVQGRMFASLSNIGLALKLPEAEQQTLLEEPEAKPLQYEQDAPISRHYVVVPDDFVSDKARLVPWVEKSIRYALTLPAPKRAGTRGQARKG